MLLPRFRVTFEGDGRASYGKAVWKLHGQPSIAQLQVQGRVHMVTSTVEEEPRGLAYLILIKRKTMSDWDSQGQPQLWVLLGLRKLN